MYVKQWPTRVAVTYTKYVCLISKVHHSPFSAAISNFIQYIFFFTLKLPTLLYPLINCEVQAQGRLIKN